MTVSYTLNLSDQEKLKSTASKQQQTLSTVLQYLWVRTLADLKQEKQVSYATMTSGREDEEDDVFMHAGFVIVNTEVSQTLSAFAEKLLQCYQSKRDASAEQVDTLFVYENYPRVLDDKKLNNVTVSFPKFFTQSFFPLTLVVLPEKKLRFILSYRQECFSHHQVQQWMQAYVKKILDYLCA